MKNVLSRDEYLGDVSEGFIKDTIKKGVNAVKNAFKIGMRKIKDIIAIFDKNGNVLPVVAPQAVVDKFAGNDNIKVYGTKALSDSVVAAGGKGCPDNAPLRDDEETYDIFPDDEDSIEMKNLMAIPSIINECYDAMDDETKKLFEDFEDVKAQRVSYSKDAELKEIKTINVEEFEKLLNDMIDERILGNVVMDEDGKAIYGYRNALIWGAPGVGKSTVPNKIVDKFNHMKDDREMMSLITVDCANITVGDFMMPTMPQEKDIRSLISDDVETFPQAAEYLKGLDKAASDAVDKTLFMNKQWIAGEAPKSWLPSYKKTGKTKIDRILDAYANGGVYEEQVGIDTETHRTGNGGIIMFDELLRADFNVFKQLMIFLLTRELNGWKLGSKWVIIACTNRPSDDDQVKKVYNEWKAAPATKDRFDVMYYLEPDKEGWIKWARKKKYDELMLQFIFDEDSKSGSEYPRWHSAVKKGTEGVQVRPITPRRWESALNSLYIYKKKNGLSDISEMDESAIRELFERRFDQSFVTEIMNWLDIHMNNVKLEEVMANPKGTYLPAKYNGKDEALAIQLLKGLLDQFKKKAGKNFEGISDEEFLNVIIWLGINYKNTPSYVSREFIGKLEDLGYKQDEKDLADNGLDPRSLLGHKEVMLMIFAAFPSDVENLVAALKDMGYPEDSMDIIKKYMKENFPWRLDGDRIIDVDELDV